MIDGDISSTDKIDKIGAIGGEGPKMPSMPSSSFETYMKQPPGAPGGASHTQSPFDLAHGQVLPGTPTMGSLTGQMNHATQSLGDIRSQLDTQGLKLSHPQKYLLEQKLTDAAGHLRSVNAKLGGAEIPASQVAPGAKPIERFLAMLTDGQNMMESAKNQLESLKAKGESLSPGDMLLIQVKMNKAQQEIEYSSVLLSKAVDVLKQMMNIQI